MTSPITREQIAEIEALWRRFENAQTSWERDKYYPPFASKLADAWPSILAAHAKPLPPLRERREGMTHKIFSTLRILFVLGTARTFGEYEHSAWNGEFNYAQYRWRGKSWVIPTGHIGE